VLWHRSNRFDKRALPLADRHYSRQKPGTPQFVRPGRNVVLLTRDADALWVSSWHRPDLVKHAFGYCWECSIFRNESAALSSDLIVGAMAATRAVWGEPPPGGFLTFVDERRVRRKRDPGRCFRRAGFEPVGRTKDKDFLALRLPREALPAAEAPRPMLRPLSAQLRPLPASCRRVYLI
jgi:hypothetical protein